MTRPTAFYVALAVSALSILILPYPDFSGHGTCAGILAIIALAGTNASIALAILNIFRDKEISPNLEMSLWMALSPFGQLLFLLIFHSNLGFEDLSGVTWLGCGWLLELCAIPLLITTALRWIRRRRGLIEK